MHLLLFLLITVELSQEWIYFASPNMLTWRSANNYCSHICGSSLASIHNIADHISVKHAVYNEPLIDTLAINKIWIGLYYFVRDNTWKWMDGTPFDYGNTNETNDIHPWISNISISHFTSTQRACVVMDALLDFKWEIKTGDECDEFAHFVCHQCGGKLIKYLLIHNKTSNFTEADKTCSDKLGTHLQSIHNENDYSQSKLLCLFGSNAENDCWLGISVDITWNDGTFWDYGKVLNKYPWTDNNNIDRHSCGAMSTDESYLWQMDSCGDKKRIVCGMPNELCYAENWESLYDEKVIINSGKQWVNNNGVLVIEYMFGSGTAGIYIYNFPQSVCNNYFIGISKNEKLFIMRCYENMQHEIYSVYINQTDAFFYILNIKITNGTYFDIKLNNIQYILFNDDMFNSSITKPMSNISGFIGLAIDNTQMHSKYLYISGSPIFIDLNHSDIVLEFNACPLTPLLSTNATSTTDKPIFSTSQPKSYKMCIDITCTIDSNQSEMDKITNDILDIINSVTCIDIETIEEDYSVNVSLIDNKIAIAAEISVCLNNTLQILTQQITDIDSISNLKMDLIISCRYDLIASTYTSLDAIIPIKNDKDKSTTLSTAEWIAIIMCVITVCLCIIIIGAIKHLRQQKLKNNENSKEINGNSVFNLDIFRIKTVEVECVECDSEAIQKWNKSGYVNYTKHNNDSNTFTMHNLAKLKDDFDEEDSELKQCEYESNNNAVHMCGTEDESAMVDESVGILKGSISTTTTMCDVNEDYEFQDDDYTILL